MTDANLTEQNLEMQLATERAKNANLSKRLADAEATVDRLITELKKAQRAKTDPDTEAVISGLMEQIKTQAARIGELEGQLRELGDELNAEKRCYAGMCDARDEVANLLREAKAERDTWKQVAKWLVKRIGGDGACS